MVDFQKQQAENQARAERLCKPTTGKIDSSSYDEKVHDTSKPTGKQPSPPLFRKDGGRVEGKEAEVRADRAPRKSGGRVAPVSVNITVESKKEDPLMPMPGGLPPKPMMPPPMPPPGAGGPPPGGMPPMGAGAVPGALAGMGRRLGGRVDSYPIKDGAGGGKGRLQKAAAAKRK